MKIIIRLTCSTLLLLSILGLPGTAVSSETGQLDITDQVTEMSPDGSYLQIGDYGIVQVDNIMDASVPDDIHPISLSRITTGATVRVRIVPHSNDGQWVAEELYLLSEGEQADSPNEASSGEMFLEGGTWKN